MDYGVIPFFGSLRLLMLNHLSGLATNYRFRYLKKALEYAIDACLDPFPGLSYYQLQLGVRVLSEFAI